MAKLMQRSGVVFIGTFKKSFVRQKYTVRRLPVKGSADGVMVDDRAGCR